MKKWTFDFCKDEGHIVVDPGNEDQSRTIRDALAKGKPFINIPIDGREVYINLNMVKLAVLGEEPEIPTVTPEVIG